MSLFLNVLNWYYESNLQPFFILTKTDYLKEQYAKYSFNRFQRAPADSWPASHVVFPARELQDTAVMHTMLHAWLLCYLTLQTVLLYSQSASLVSGWKVLHWTYRKRGYIQRWTKTSSGETEITHSPFKKGIRFRAKLLQSSIIFTILALSQINYILWVYLCTRLKKLYSSVN